ncbi:MAG: hypothetical protein J3K34DRAFT_248717 [Monoraphidium minutum]|nr:MAG: hypothetical protein J3K34DRAFT_248717 [Monoraphidium minutum]
MRMRVHVCASSAGPAGPRLIDRSTRSHAGRGRLGRPSSAPRKHRASGGALRHTLTGPIPTPPGARPGAVQQASKCRLGEPARAAPRGARTQRRALRPGGGRAGVQCVSKVEEWEQQKARVGGGWAQAAPSAGPAQPLGRARGNVRECKGG